MRWRPTGRHWRMRSSKWSTSPTFATSLMLRSVDGRRTATVQSGPAVVQPADSAARLDMKLNPQDLENIAHLTLERYNQHAEEFWESTRNHDVNQNIAALLQYIESEPPFRILDFGCGPGRDLRVFSELGHSAIGLEGAAQFAAMARAYSGCEVWQQDFLKLDLPKNYFDGVFANASLFPQSGVAARVAGTACMFKAGWCGLARTRAVITRKAGAVGATACIMILKLGVTMCQPRGSLSLLTITAPSACRANASRG